MISANDFDGIENAYNQADQRVKQEQVNLTSALQNYDIIKTGTTSGLGAAATTQVRSTITGMILDVPVKTGNQVIEANNFNDGTTIATLADVDKMIFEGKVDEAEVGKIRKDIDLEITLGAVSDKKFPAKLNFIAPKGTEESGAVQFTIKADVTLDDDYFLRAGYSANAEIVLEKKDSVLSIQEALLQFDKKTEKPFVEIQTGDNTFEKRDLKLGISDGINVEILEGVTKDDKIKIWNKKFKKEETPEEGEEEESEAED